MLGIELQHTRIYRDAQLEWAKKLVLKILTRKFGNISPEVRSRVNNLDIDKLESIGEDLLDFTSIAELEAWLSQN